MFKKIVLIVVLAMSVVGCTAHDMALWKEAKQERKERGVKCYRDENGYVYCEDRYGNRY
ncbi:MULTISPECIES: hypothetical protein [unclassified Leptotrichia]|uniref:hypothetical protein n=1 Tax=unclassified Leptotrichia TaxID=2633022 RepID=UPI0003ADC2AD|nr:MULTISPECIES: hypothetical protein [unclassified Leptotrichia]ERL25070.1 hypothetical protein HMPREF9108_01931 [Leptotrichia sp. oral taxon 225 str. F0581]WLD75421.1 hypothetical protein QU666_05990 [Leptotrichia sp. HMT-225]